MIAGGSGLGTISLVMTGSGTQVLAGSNTYTGPTTINSGNLAVIGSLNPSSSVTVNSPGTLSGAGTVGSVIVEFPRHACPGLGWRRHADGQLVESWCQQLVELYARQRHSHRQPAGHYRRPDAEPRPDARRHPGQQLEQRHVCLGRLRLAHRQFQQLQRLDGRRQPLAGPAHLRLQRRQRQPRPQRGHAAVVNGTWNASGGGSWNTAGDWQGGTSRVMSAIRPRSARALAAPAATVTLDGARGLSGLTLNTTGGGSYTLSRSGGDTASTLLLANGGSTVTVSVSGGSQTIAVPVAFFDNVNVSVNSGASLTVSGAVGDGGTGKSLTLSGSGTLILAGANSYAGPTTVGGGTLQIGAGGAGASLASPSVSLSSNTPWPSTIPMASPTAASSAATAGCSSRASAR